MVILACLTGLGLAGLNLSLGLLFTQRGRVQQDSRYLLAGGWEGAALLALLAAVLSDWTLIAVVVMLAVGLIALTEWQGARHA